MGQMKRSEPKVTKAVAERFKEIRKAKGISQELVLIDTDYPISILEMGKTNVTITTIYLLCDYFGVTLKEFFDGIEIK